MAFFGRRMIMSDATEITRDNVADVLLKAMNTHAQNRAEIEYLWQYYRGNQPILCREKKIRPEINAHVLKNIANEIVSFKTGYLMGEPIAYVSCGDNVGEEISQLNSYCRAEEKASKDKELADWMHICGTGFRMVFPDENNDAPFELYTLDPRNTFVVYSKELGNKPLMAVRYVDSDNIPDAPRTFSVYTKDRYFKISGTLSMLGVMEETPHILGNVPIIEYPLNMARMGAFEVVISLLDAINQTESDRVNSVEGFVQALMRFHNTDISSEDFDELREKGAIKYKDIEPGMKAEVDYIIAKLDQSGTQILVDDLYDSVLTICGMPNRNTGNGDNGIAVIYRDGWSAAETRAKGTEEMFKKSERQMLKILLNICETYENMTLKVSDIDIRFTRRNYENILQKAQVLDMMLKNGQIDPKLAFQHCGMFADPDLAYSLSKIYVEETANASKDIPENDRGDASPVDEGQQSGIAD